MLGRRATHRAISRQSCPVDRFERWRFASRALLVPHSSKLGSQIVACGRWAHIVRQITARASSGRR